MRTALLKRLKRNRIEYHRQQLREIRRSIQLDHEKRERIAHHEKCLRELKNPEEKGE